MWFWGDRGHCGGGIKVKGVVLPGRVLAAQHMKEKRQEEKH